MITKANPFYNGQIFRRIDGTRLLFRKRITWAPQETDRIHVVNTTDTIDSLAYQYYAQKIADAEKYWWLIADANKIMNPLDLSAWVGKTLRIPDVSLLGFVAG